MLCRVPLHAVVLLAGLSGCCVRKQGSHVLQRDKAAARLLHPREAAHPKGSA
jgi:hypothetical protein